MAETPTTPVTQKRPDLFVMSGDSGLDHRGGMPTREFLRQLQGPRGIEKFREQAMNDPISGAILTLVGLLFRQAEKRITPANDTPEAQDCAQFVREAMGDMEHEFAVVEDEFLTSRWAGNSLHEWTLKERRGPNPDDPTRHSQYTDGRIGWRSIRLRNQTTITKWIREGGRYVAAEQSIPGGARVTIPLSRCVHFRTTDVLDDPNGLSDLRSGHRSWHFASTLEEDEAISLHRHGTGVAVMEMPGSLLDSERPEDQRRVQSLLDRMASIQQGESVALAVPASRSANADTGYRFYFAKVEGNAPDYDKTIRRHDSRRAMTMFGDFLLLGHEGVGSFALADNKTNLAGLAIGAILKRFCSTFTAQAIHPLCAINGFRREAWPALTHGDVETPDLAVLAGFINTMVGANVLTIGPELEEYVRTAGGLPQRQLADMSQPQGGGTGAPATVNPDDPNAPPTLSSAAQEQTINVGQTIRQLSLSLADMATAASAAQAAGDAASAAAFLELAAELREKIRALNQKL